MLGTLNNKNLYKIEIPKIDNIEVTGLNDDENLKLVNSLNLFKSQSLFILNRLELEKILNSNSLIEIDYPHITKQFIVKPSYAKANGIDLKNNVYRVGYIMGAGDKIPKTLKK